ARLGSGRYKSAKDLKGMKVAVAAPGSGSSTSIDRYLSTVGLTIADVDLTYLGFPQMVPALEKRAVDAAFVVEPLRSAAEASGAAGSIVSGDQMFPHPQIAVAPYSAPSTQP